jgi:hypothetical protein
VNRESLLGAGQEGGKRQISSSVDKFNERAPASSVSYNVDDPVNLSGGALIECLVQ